MKTAAVEVRDLRVALTRSEDIDIISDVSFSIAAGEVLGLVGESGSGKSTTGLALLGHCRAGARITHGTVHIGDVDVLAASPAEQRKLRGSLVSYVPQDPAAALNPAIRVGAQLREMINVHKDVKQELSAQERIAVALGEVKLPSDKQFLQRYPHQLSGGQQQRICIAMAFLLRPRVIVMDEPTTGLDVTTQAYVLATVARLCKVHSVAALYVTHDLAVVANIADRVMVMYGGRVVEDGLSSQIFAGAAHPYTRKLNASIPDMDNPRQLEAIPGYAPAPGARPTGCVFRPRCTWAVDSCLQTPPEVVVSEGHRSFCFRATEVAQDQPEIVAASTSWKIESSTAILQATNLNAWHGKRQIVRDVSLDLQPNECVAIVGESGSGKTTLARTLVGLHAKWNGDIRFQGEPLVERARNRPADVRQMLQYIFQSPYNSLNPRRTVSASIGLPIDLFFDVSRQERRQRVRDALDHVGLSAATGEKLPAQLSGGERQRVSIARALVCEPRVLVCDEITSALDVSVQASIVRLLARLQAEDGLALLFITHNLPLARTIAQRVIVMSEGRIVEAGPTAEVYANPQDAYTRQLIQDSPSIPA